MSSYQSPWPGRVLAFLLGGVLTFLATDIMTGDYAKPVGNTPYKLQSTSRSVGDDGAMTIRVCFVRETRWDGGISGFGWFTPDTLHYANLKLKPGQPVGEFPKGATFTKAAVTTLGGVWEPDPVDVEELLAEGSK